METNALVHPEQPVAVFSERIFERLTKSKGFLNSCFHRNDARLDFDAIPAQARIQRGAKLELQSLAFLYITIFSFANALTGKPYVLRSIFV